MISIGNITYSADVSGAGPFDITHDNDKDFLACLIAYRDNADNTLSASFNSVAMTIAKSKVISGGSVLKAVCFYLINPILGSNTLRVTTSGSINDFLAFGSISLGGIDLLNPIDNTAEGGETPGTEDPRSSSITTVTRDAIILDVMADRAGAPTSEGAGQTEIFNVGAGDTMKGSYKIATSIASYNMDWDVDASQVAEDWAHALVSFRAATLRTLPLLGAGL